MINEKNAAEAGLSELTVGLPSTHRIASDGIIKEINRTGYEYRLISVRKRQERSRSEYVDINSSGIIVFTSLNDDFVGITSGKLMGTERPMALYLGEAISDQCNELYYKQVATEITNALLKYQHTFIRNI
jgi:hypothetical protein